MKITIAGVGYVGLVTALCFAEIGHEITCIDIDETKISMLKQGKSPISEKGIESLLAKQEKKMVFTSDKNIAYRNADIIFICVGTPEKEDGSVDLSYVYQVVDDIHKMINHGGIIVIKSTVPVGTSCNIKNIFTNHKYSVEVVSNPEFLSQGSAIKDTMAPERIIIGTDSENAKQVMGKLYRYFGVPILFMSNNSAEMVKYASNDFLALKISFINEIANLCEIVDANIDEVTNGMGYDSRIGPKFLKAGIGYGGSCFPKDTKATHWLASTHGYELKTIKATIEVNEAQKLKLIEKARKIFKKFYGLKIAILGITFKPGTDDIREAPSLENIKILLDEGANVVLYDPLGQEKVARLFPEIQFAQTIDEAIFEADLCMIFTEWMEIVNYNVEKFVRFMKKPIVLDGRNCFSLDKMRMNSVRYECIGKVMK